MKIFEKETIVRYRFFLIICIEWTRSLLDLTRWVFFRELTLNLLNIIYFYSSHQMKRKNYFLLNVLMN